MSPDDVDAAADALARAEGDGARFGSVGEPAANALGAEALAVHIGIGALLAMRAELAERYRTAGAPECVFRRIWALVPAMNWALIPEDLGTQSERSDGVRSGSERSDEVEGQGVG